jgi:hypothetical protein
MYKTFTTPYEQHKEREGQKIEVLAIISESDKTHDVEVLPMYKVRFSDGVEIEAWPEELGDD